MAHTRAVPWNSFTWNRHFSTRQPLSYKAEDIRIQLSSPDTAASVFLKVRAGVLDPPCLNFKQLERFLGEASLTDLNSQPPSFRLSRLALLDDRRDPIGLDPAPTGQTAMSNGQMRNWESEQYTRRPPPGENIYREVLDEKSLYDKLSQKVCIAPRAYVPTVTKMLSRGRPTRRNDEYCECLQIFSMLWTEK